MKKFIRINVTYDIPMEFVNEADAEDFFIDICDTKNLEIVYFVEGCSDKIPIAADVVYMGDEDDISE